MANLRNEMNRQAIRDMQTAQPTPHTVYSKWDAIAEHCTACDLLVRIQRNPRRSEEVLSLINETPELKAKIDALPKHMHWSESRNNTIWDLILDYKIQEDETGQLVYVSSGGSIDATPNDVADVRDSATEIDHAEPNSAPADESLSTMMQR